LHLSETENGFELKATDEDGNVSNGSIGINPKRKKKPRTTSQLKKTSKLTLAKQVSHTADEITIASSENWFTNIQNQRNAKNGSRTTFGNSFG
jgi:putative protease